MKGIVVFDYDGTLIQAVKSENIDWFGDMETAWREFAERADEMPLIEETLADLKNAGSSTNFIVCLVTARPKFLSGELLADLERRDIAKYFDYIFCRPDHLVEKEFIETSKLNDSDDDDLSSVIKLVHEHHADYRRKMVDHLELTVGSNNFMVAYDDQQKNLDVFADTFKYTTLVNENGELYVSQRDH